MATVRPGGRGRVRVAAGRSAVPAGRCGAPRRSAGPVHVARTGETGDAPAGRGRGTPATRRTGQRAAHDRQGAPGVCRDGAVQPVRPAGVDGVVRTALRGPAGRPRPGRSDRPRRVGGRTPLPGTDRTRPAAPRFLLSVRMVSPDGTVPTHRGMPDPGSGPSPTGDSEPPAPSCNGQRGGDGRSAAAGAGPPAPGRERQPAGTAPGRHGPARGSGSPGRSPTAEARP